jgi:hypothetical protein
MKNLEILALFTKTYNWTWEAGQKTGKFWFTCVVPALLVAGDAISWFVAQIDWAEVRAIVRQGLTIVAAAAIAAGTLAQPTLVKLSAALGRRYAALLAPQPVAPAAPAIQAATVAPVAVAPAPVTTTVNQLRALARKELGSGAKIAGRRIAQAKRQDLLEALMAQGVALA